eukprot:TRINITY_DN2878_c0_g1_i1.p1 TRINITY_DN2878_c0_g1~~TRINITY_DN2878_c0_g1_i1.p1  ORF type:complete len:305 (+),score=72.23 TRINITY_DN2878_c0_g1_i1:147-1061(+)
MPPHNPPAETGPVVDIPVLTLGPLSAQHPLVAPILSENKDAGIVNRADRKKDDPAAIAAVSVQPTHSDAVLAEVAAALKPGSRFVLRPLVGDVPADVLSKTSETFQRIAPLITPAAAVQTKLLLAGFVNTQTSQPQDITSVDHDILTSFGVTDADLTLLAPHLQYVQFTTETPDYAAEETQGLNLKKKAGSTPAATWSLDDAGDDDDLVDEDALLGDDELRSKPTDTEDCRTNTRIACKNCVCGRAEELAQEKVTIELDGMDPEEKASACGNCTRGDAFRCATCPSLGLPVGQRKVGEKIELVL